MSSVEPLTGDALQKALPALAELRIRVFRAWSYLYDGTLDYEEKYLKKFSAADDALVVVARDGDRIVGASTASPLVGHADEFAAPFAARGYDPQRVFYFGESVLLPEYRGRGIGHAFFDARESHARESGDFNIATFCAVVRADDDPRRPPEYRPLDPFWNARGFQKEDGMVANFDWKEIDKDGDVTHDMQFWMKKL